LRAKEPVVAGSCRPLRRRARIVSIGALVTVGLVAVLLRAEKPAHAATVIRVPGNYPNLQAAIDAAAPGDVIEIAAGTYSVNVTVDVAVTIRGADFDTADPRANTTILDGGGSSVVAIRAGVSPAPSLVGLVLANGDSGVVTNSPVKVSHSYFVSNSGDSLEYEPGGGGISRNNVFADSGDDAIDLDHMVRDVRVVRNRIFDSGDDGIEIRLHDDVIAQTVDLVIRNCEIVGSAEDGLQVIDYYADTNRRIIVRGNLFRNSAMAAIGLMDNGTTKEDYRGASVRERIHVFHNTFVANDHGISGGDNLIALNNLFEGHALALKNVDGGSVASYNLFWNNAVNAGGSNVMRTKSVFADPVLNARYRPSLGSPAVDAGTSYFEWNSDVVMSQPASRYEGSAPDIGWYERRQ
jgi:hypothetical protein